MFPSSFQFTLKNGKELLYGLHGYLFPNCFVIDCNIFGKQYSTSKSTETSKRQEVQSFIHLFQKVSNLWNGKVPSSRRTSSPSSLIIIISSWKHLCRLVADSYFIKWCNTVLYTLENSLVNCFCFMQNAINSLWEWHLSHKS